VVGVTGTPDARTERTVWFRVLADYKRGWVNTAYVTDAMESIVAARVRAAQAQAWDEACGFHFREGDDPFGPIGDHCDRNPYRSGDTEEQKSQVDRAEGEEDRAGDSVVSSHTNKVTDV
jgi:hypothetical protein